MSYVSALLAAAKTEEEYFEIVQQLIQSRTVTLSANSITAPSEESAPLVDLANENEDDYFGILHPIKHNVNK